MIKLLEYCFDKWKKPLKIWILTWVLFIAGDYFDINQIFNPLWIALCISAVWMLLSVIYQLVKSRWLRAIATILILACGVVALQFYVVSVGSSQPYDHYADNLIIPENITIHEPLSYKPPIELSDTDFALYKGIQPGVYDYVVFSKKIKKGIVYLKAFEVTHNDPLSADELRKHSEIDVGNDSDTLRSFVRIKKPGSFTIYEGDLGKPYAARFELWYIDKSSGEEQMLTDKIYKIEGWQR